NGSYGSLLAASITSSAAYVKTTPANVSALAVNSAGMFDVNADSTALLASSSPYSVQLTVQDPSASNNPQTIDVTLVVRPKATISLIPDDLSFNVSGPGGGPWPTIPPQTFQVVNSGPSGSVLGFQIQKLTGNSDWLSFTPTFGTLSGGAGQAITVNAAPTAG